MFQQVSYLLIGPVAVTFARQFSLNPGSFGRVRICEPAAGKWKFPRDFPAAAI
jgi:hypothetical protein